MSHGRTWMTSSTWLGQSLGSWSSSLPCLWSCTGWRNRCSERGAGSTQPSWLCTVTSMSGSACRVGGKASCSGGRQSRRSVMQAVFAWLQNLVLSWHRSLDNFYARSVMQAVFAWLQNLVLSWHCSLDNFYARSVMQVAFAWLRNVVLSDAVWTLH